MKRATAVIGANFGDEGKGHVVDHLAAKVDAVVVRFNGGAQAGHTVVTDGKRHIFSHIGSGAFSNCPTYLAEPYVCNPVLFVEEIEQRWKGDRYPQIACHPKARVTTPWDMVVNQYLENARGVNRHGSCGVGFGETIERHEHGFPLYVKDLVESGLRERLERMAFDWYPRRLQALGISASKPHHFEEYYTLYSQQIKKFVQRVRIADYSAINATNSFIFEGAQGLLLDQDHHYFPHVTRSKTGLGAAVRVAEQLGVHWLEPVYVTRSYVTRHGAGPLPEECERLGKDETNVAHPFQGELRYAKLDLEMLRHRVGVDWSSFYSPDVLIDGPSLAVNCLDQTDGAFITPRGNVKWTELKGWVKYASFGSDRLDIEEIR